MKLSTFKFHSAVAALCVSFLVTACSQGIEAGKNDSGSNGSSGNGDNPSTTTTTTLPPVGPTPTPVPTPTPTPPPEPDNFDIFADVAVPVGQRVDNYYSNYRELLVQRSSTSSHRVDSCDPNLDQHYTFAERVAYYVQVNSEPRRAQLSFIGDLFGIPTTQSKFYPTSMISHRMCNVTAQTLATTIGSSRVPSSATIAKLNTFADRYNEARNRMLAGDPNGQKDLMKFWGKFMMCLSYTESLTTAETAKSYSVASKYAPSDYRKPAGVKFYEDPNQPAASMLNIGLFQFTPDGGGNINPCLKQWNEIYPSCQVSTGSSTAEMIRVTGSSYQTFNAFCGTNKVHQMFSVQVNATKTKNTHPSNVVGGSLKPPADRCVSLHFTPGTSYNHFGPFQNSTGSNLDSLMTCALAQ